MKQFAMLAVNACLGALGEDVSYFPVIGSSRTLRVIRYSGEKLVDGLGVTQHRHDGAVFETLGSAVLSPQAGDMLISSDARWRVRSVRKDSQSVAWTLDCIPA